MSCTLWVRLPDVAVTVTVEVCGFPGGGALGGAGGGVLLLPPPPPPPQAGENASAPASIRTAKTGVRARPRSRSISATHPPRSRAKNTAVVELPPPPNGIIMPEIPPGCADECGGVLMVNVTGTVLNPLSAATGLLHVDPVGRPLQVKLTVPLKLLIPVTFNV